MLAFTVASWSTSVLSSTINSVAMPAFSALGSDPRALEQMLGRATQAVSLIAFPVGALTAALSYPLIEVVYGEAWIAAARPVNPGGLRRPVLGVAVVVEPVGRNWSIRCRDGCSVRVDSGAGPLSGVGDPRAWPGGGCIRPRRRHLLHHCSHVPVVIAGSREIGGAGSVPLHGEAGLRVGAGRSNGTVGFQLVHRARGKPGGRMPGRRADLLRSRDSNDQGPTSRSAPRTRPSPCPGL